MRKNQIILGLLVLIALIAVAFTLASGYRLPDFDEREYYRLADTIIRTGQYSNVAGQPTSFWPPLYPFFLSLFMLISKDILFLKFTGSIILLGIAFVCYRLANRHSSLSGILALVAICCYPLFFYSASRLFPQTLGGLLFALTVALVSARPRPAWRLVLGSLAYGLLILTIPGFLMLGIVILPGVYLLGVGSAGTRIRSMVLFAGGSVLVLAPWIARNYYVFGCLIPVSTNGGINLLIGNSESTSYNSSSNIDIRRYTIVGETLGETESDHYYRRSAAAWFFGNPQKSIPLYFMKVMNYFNFKNQYATPDEHSLLKDYVLLITYSVLIIFMIIRIIFIKYIPLSSTEKFILFIYFSNSFLSAVFLTRIRYRIPFDYLLIVIASSGATCLFSHIRARMARQDSAHV